MDPFSYICVLTSIVAGLAVTRLVSGFGQLLQTRARTPPYWVHALWMVNVLLTMNHHLVGPIPLAQRPALDPVPLSLAARRAVDPLPRRGTALSHQPG